ncbi:hypothetical protein ACFSLT_24910 [Novosphingobium resinovorum]
MQEARAKLAHLDCRITFAAVYGVPGKSGGADFVFETVPEPRVFEWNVLHHPIVSRSCFDIDGVLCVDPTERENDDGARYLNFLASAVPLHRPRREIAMLVTSRLEKYRAPTEDWLDRHGVRYGQLRMLDLPDAAARRACGHTAVSRRRFTAKPPATCSWRANCRRPATLRGCPANPCSAFRTRRC